MYFELKPPRKMTVPLFTLVYHIHVIYQYTVYNILLYNLHKAYTPGKYINTDLVPPEIEYQLIYHRQQSMEQHRFNIVYATLEPQPLSRLSMYPDMINLCHK
jgi:hypothetical protein